MVSHEVDGFASLTQVQINLATSLYLLVSIQYEAKVIALGVEHANPSCTQFGHRCWVNTLCAHADRLLGFDHNVVYMHINVYSRLSSHWLGYLLDQ